MFMQDTTRVTYEDDEQYQSSVSFNLLIHTYLKSYCVFLYAEIKFKTNYIFLKSVNILDLLCI